jgi:hypothetical protein
MGLEDPRLWHNMALITAQEVPRDVLHGVRSDQIEGPGDVQVDPCLRFQGRRHTGPAEARQRLVERGQVGVS